jgi:TRAP transporter TAXI family solute receptor
MKGTRKGLICCLLVGLITFGISAFTQTSWAADSSKYPKQLVFRGGTVGGPWVPMANLMADFMMKRFSGLNVLVQPGGAISNLRILEEGKDAVMGFTYGPLYWEAREGTFDKGKTYKNIYALLVATASFQQFAVLASSNIRSIKDLKDKRIAPGHRGGGDDLSTRRILEAYGITYDSIRKAGGTVSFVQVQEMGMGLRDGVYDFGNFAGNAPHAVLQDVQTTKRLRLLSVDAEHEKKILAKYPYYAFDTVPAGTFKGQKKPARLMLNTAVLIVHKSLPDGFVYELTKLLIEKGTEIRKSLAFIDRLNPPSRAVAGLRPDMMHPAAVRYFKKIGVFK